MRVFQKYGANLKQMATVRLWSNLEEAMQRSLFDDDQSSFDGVLPDQARVPLNMKGRTVYSVLIKDLCDPADVLLVTGYSGLDQLIQLITARGEARSPLRLLLGSDPVASENERLTLNHYEFSDEIRKFWLEKGISLALGAHVLRAIELIRAGHVRVRYPVGRDRLHAKIYCAAAGVTVGSSNYTRPGLFSQREVNLRITPKESRRFYEIWQVAECFWSQGREASSELIGLLERLLKFVTWREALARACAELLESEWANHYLKSLGEVDPVELWPAQRQGIGQALYLIDTLGAVLVADATGSGKTRLGAHLIRAIHDRNWSSLRSRKGSILLVCPPLVRKHWEKEAAKCGTSVTIVSQGILSRMSPDDESALAIQLSTAQTLAVDEAHNFLSQTSKRTAHLKHNLADQVVLFTATPINRSRADLLRLIDIIGADNFDDHTLTVFERLNKKGKFLTSPEDLEVLQAAIGSFTVRRTKSQFNAMVTADPEPYRLPSGHVCRYPEQQSSIYELAEPTQDRAYAWQIRQLGQQLNGVSYFQKPLIEPDILINQGMSAEQYLDIRLRAAKSLALYHVMSSLRSSSLALHRHVSGEEEACRLMGLRMQASKGAGKDAGNVLERLQSISGQCPENHLGAELPDWLTDPAEHRKACVRESEIYRAIGECLLKMSDHREMEKVRHLMRMFEIHNQVLAFDHYPLTLRYLAYLWTHVDPGRRDIEVMLGIGGEKRTHELIQKKLDPANESATPRLVLCSDALSEGVNLQGASTVTHLDMPSVVRVAEQRVGRVDRMDSRHRRIECWWPMDAKEFALRSDEIFVFRVDDVDTLIGGNLQLPEEIRAAKASKVITPQAMEEEVRKYADRRWDGIEDAFAPVRGLVSGKQALVKPDIYEMYRDETAKVLSRVSIVDATEPWVFLCLAGEKSRAPRWIFLARHFDQPITSLREIDQLLRARLTDAAQTLEPSRAAMGELQVFLSRLGEMDKMLLPRLKQRALEQMNWAINLWARNPEWITTAEQADEIKRLKDVFAGTAGEHVPDWGAMADGWIALVRPRWVELLQTRNRRTPFKRLRDLEPSLRRTPIDVGALLSKLDGIEFQRPWEERIVACILGYGASIPGL